ncbi:MAG TPA: adenylate/guanylate cyclase domain-containing protein [Chloroflexota bacterium]
MLFGDVKGYTAMSEHLPPEEVAEIMNSCFEALSQPVVKYGGSIDKYVGDAIMARFGAPRAHEDDPVRAIQAALAMQEALARFRQNLAGRTGSDLSMRIGINTGQVVMGEVGSSALKQFTLMGNAVNLASRLEHAAEPGSILVGESTYRLAKHAFEFQAVPPLQIRGQSELIHAFVPLRSRVNISSPHARVGGQQLPLVARSTELEQLNTYLAEAYRGEGRLVAVVGEPGVGKSRLAEELWKRHQNENILRIYAAAPSFGENIPYAMLVAFIRGLLFGETEQPEVRPQELHDAVHTLLSDERAEDAEAILAEVLGISQTNATDVSQLHARSRQGLLTNTLKLLLTVRSRQRPMLLVLDDMHWADSASRSVFEQILKGIRGLPILALMLYRPTFSHALSGMALYRQINLHEIPPEDAKNLLQEYLGSFAIPGLVGDRVIEKSGGNPFFLEQILTSLVESGTIVQKDGKWDVTQDISRITIPDTIQEILLGRIDQLSRGARSVLEVAAVIGRVFAHRLLQSIVDAERDLDSYLAQLETQEFIHEKNLVPELEYMFKHSLTQDVVYNGLLESQRRIFHLRVAETIESLGGSPTGEQLPFLALHYGKSDKWEKGLEYSIAAGQRARHLYANDDALQCFHQALEILGQRAPDDTARRLLVLEGLGDTFEILARFEEADSSYRRARDDCPTPTDRARLCRKLGDLAQSRGRHAEATTRYREAEIELAAVDDPTERANIWLGRARNDRLRGALDAASAACLKALSLSGMVDEMTLASLYFELGEAESERGNSRSASGYFEAAAGIWNQLGAVDKQALAIQARAEGAFQSGRLIEAQQYFDEALSTYRRVADRHEAARVLCGIGKIGLAMGNLEAAVDCLVEGMAVATEIDDALLQAICTFQLGAVHLERGNEDEAKNLLDSSYASFKQMRNWRGLAEVMVSRAELLKRRGEFEQARTAIRRASSLAAEINDRRLLVRAYLGAAELDVAMGEYDAADKPLAAALSLARDLSDARLTAQTERVCGRARARQGRTQSALTMLRASATALRECGAFLDAAHAELDFARVACASHNGPRVEAGQMLDFALDTFERAGAQGNLQQARSLAMQLAAPTSASMDTIERPGAHLRADAEVTQALVFGKEGT